MSGRGACQGVSAGARGVVGELLAVGGVAAVPPTWPKLVVAIVRIITGQREISAFKVRAYHVRLCKIT